MAKFGEYFGIKCPDYWSLTQEQLLNNMDKFTAKQKLTLINQLTAAD